MIKKILITYPYKTISVQEDDHHAYVVEPDKDISEQVDKYSKAEDKQAIASELEEATQGVWTDQVIAEWKKKKIDDRIEILDTQKQSIERRLDQMNPDQKEAAKARRKGLAEQIEDLRAERESL